MTRKDLAAAIYKSSYIQGHFKLRSGQTSNEYFDKYRFESNPEILAEIAKKLVPLIPPETEILAGLEMGGIPIATALSLVSGIPVCFVRKAAKEYGTLKFAEGIDVTNKRLCIIEDVITTGGQVIESAHDLRKIDAQANHVLCVIDREQGGRDKLHDQKLWLQSLFKMSELKGSAL